MQLLFIEQLSLLPFPFDLRTSRSFHGRTAITDSSRNIHGLSRTYERATIRDISRNIHGAFTDLWTNGNYELFTELSRIYGQLRTFHGIFTELRMSLNCSRIIMVTGHKTLVIVYV